MKSSLVFSVHIVLLISFSLSACNIHREEQQHEAQVITATRPESKSVTILRQFVCQIHSQRHIEVRALEPGYLQAIEIKEGQAVKEGDLMFTVRPVFYKAKLDAEKAEAHAAELEYIFGKKLNEDKVISENEVAILKTKLQKAEANVKLAEAELDFATIKAPFSGIIDRLHCQQGSLIEKGDILTSLSDNSLMWVYFNVPETRYLDYMTNLRQYAEDLKIELVLADGSTFNHVGKLGAIEADFDNTTGNIPFRADFPNPDRLLRNGQTGTVRISRVQNDAIVIPQRTTFEVLNKLYVYVVDNNDVAHRREIVVKNELEDLFVIEKGVGVDDKIIFEGIRQVHDNEKVDYVYRPPEEVDGSLKYHAE